MNNGLVQVTRTTTPPIDHMAALVPHPPTITERILLAGKIALIDGIGFSTALQQVDAFFRIPLRR